MAKPAKNYDVWFVATNTVYRQVPFQVVAEWAQEGRLAVKDMLRVASGTEAWKAVAEWPLFSDYLPPPEIISVNERGEEVPIEVPEALEFEHRRRTREPDDDEVDMIPLIDISMVLLVFFILISASGALSPVDVPDMRYGGEHSKEPDAVTISIEKASEEDVYYTVREGKDPPSEANSHLPTPEAALRSLDALLSSRTRPPEVRVACAKDLPSERVLELSRELKNRQEKSLINSYVATVNEAPPEK